MENLNALTEAALKQVQDADDLASLDKVRVEVVEMRCAVRGCHACEEHSAAELAPSLDERPE